MHQPDFRKLIIVAFTSVVVAGLGAVLASTFDDPASPGVDPMVGLIFVLARLVLILVGVLAVMLLLGYAVQRRRERRPRGSTN